MDNIKLSIIIPHYNIPKLLVRCISSIPERNDIQVIIIDDNSLDNTEYKKIYPILSRSNVEFYTLRTNSGGGKARNEGLKYVKGKWVLFADSDDFFNYCFSDVLDEYLTDNNKYDIVFFNANSIDCETYEISDRVGYVNNYINNYVNSHNDYELRYVFGEPWCKLIRYDLIAKYNIRFDETPINNDTTFSYLIGYYAKDIIADKRAIYCLTDRKRSVSKILTDELHLVRMDVFFRKYIFLNEHGIKFPIMNDMVYRSLLFYKLKNDSIKYKECIDVGVKLGIDCKYINDAISAYFTEQRKQNRKVFLYNMLKKYLDIIIKSKFVDLIVGIKL